MIVNWNKGEVKKGQVFHFKNSLRPFIDITSEAGGDILFLDINEWEIYGFYEIQEVEGLRFYENEGDEDYLGVEIDGKIEWVD